MDMDPNVTTSNPISEHESNFYYYGLSENPPKLMWRSNLDVDPFPMPQVGDRFYTPPSKTAFGIFNSRLNEVWDEVAPRIIVLLKKHGIKYSMLKNARFLIVDQDGTEKWSSETIWIALHPNTTKAADVRSATPNILQILNDAQVYGAVVEFYEDC